MALRYAQVAVDIIEISLKEKPAEMLKLSPKGTVPVMVLPNGMVLEQSLDIMHWALQQQDSDGWSIVNSVVAQQIMLENDGSFKKSLDRYKYASRFPEHPPTFYRAQGEVFLQKLEVRLNQTEYLMSNKISWVDVAVFPFIRQFAAIDSIWFESASYAKLKVWLKQFTESMLFKSVMHP